MHCLIAAPAQTAAGSFPRKLSETGLFASTKDHVPARGLIPYSVNAELWSDGATADIAGLDAVHAFELIVDRLQAPEAAACQGCNLPAGRQVRSDIRHCITLR